MSNTNQQGYWDGIAEVYQEMTKISCDDFHYGPLLPGDSTFKLLPESVKGLTCLELACGAGQNSIFLAKQGARCTALDISPEQLSFGRRLASDNGVNIDFIQASLEDLGSLNLPKFDLVHSSFGLPFAEDPAHCVALIAEHLLEPGGELLVSLGHPVSAGEWLELDSEGEGLFLNNYFHPPADIRDAGNDETAFSRCYPISTSVEWILSAGLELTALLEPEPSEDGTPYYSEGWDECIHQLRCIPIVVILRARKPLR